MTYDYNNQYQTSYGAQGGAGGGGFMGGSQGGGSQESPSKVWGKDTLRPVTIKQILEAQQPHPEADFKIDGTEITQITFIGQVRNISAQTTNTTYKLDDGTGLIDVKQWRDQDASSIDADFPAASKKPKIEENGYVRVFGQLKAFNENRHVGSRIIRPITDFNEISFHFLEATSVHLYFTRGPPEQQQQQQQQQGGAGGVGQGQQEGGPYGQQGSEAYGAARTTTILLSPGAKRVHQYLASAPQSNEGLQCDFIAAQLGMQIADVQKAGDELLANGVIFTTVDDFTWALMEF